ncbi:hypothetical protein QJS10_CPA01g02985 [Acorus calamus]|uniref:50S ribosomal protein L35 n=1 Tax=Acorus calamus TaxID=4465 RepID=A0AAV9FP14_ACOCL|nr:hypothetical protein QJS10_CPA01g02985 [Acorus calamus]
MQRCCFRLGRVASAAVRSVEKSSPPLRSFHVSSPRFLNHHQQGPVAFPVNRSIFSPFSDLQPRSAYHPFDLGFRPSYEVLMVQRRGVSSKEKKRRTMDTPVVSKKKKYKIKAYSSYKERFRTLNDGTIRRWREGKRHNAHSKSKKAKRRLRKPEIVPAAYAKVMKKLHFCG